MLPPSPPNEPLDGDGGGIEPPESDEGGGGGGVLPSSAYTANAVHPENAVTPTIASAIEIILLLIDI